MRGRSWVEGRCRGLFSGTESKVSRFCNSSPRPTRPLLFSREGEVLLRFDVPLLEREGLQGELAFCEGVFQHPGRLCTCSPPASAPSAYTLPTPTSKSCLK